MSEKKRGLPRNSHFLSPDKGQGLTSGGSNSLISLLKHPKYGPWTVSS